MAAREHKNRMASAHRDLLALAIVAAAIIMFVGNGSEVIPQTMRHIMGNDEAVSTLLCNALLLNIALIIFGWRRYIQLALEVSERGHAEAQARLLAETDPLTGALNRRALKPRAAEMLNEAARNGQSVAFLMVDLDNFKRMNDLHGHAAGDELLRTTVARARDVLPADAMVARLGGDEFVCVMPCAIAPKTDVTNIAEHLLKTLARPIPYGDQPLESTVSIGISQELKPAEQCDVDGLLHMADQAMYHAKRGGRNRYEWFDPAMENEQRLRQAVESGICRGIGAGEFVPYYEKQIDLETGELMGFEVLARWHSPTMGLVGPDVFIAVAEQMGLIGQLSEAVIRQAFLDAAEWDPRLTLSVNISPIQLNDPWFAQKLLKLLVETNFPPSRLEIEITESVLQNDMALARSLIIGLKNQGVRVSLDDFGTGYSSLTQLKSLPFDRIKIDRSFVSSLHTNKESATIVRSIVSLGAGLGLPLTAEGVETAAVLDELRQMGPLKGQGYLYGKPASAAETLAELSSHQMVIYTPRIAPTDEPRKLQQG